MPKDRITQAHQGYGFVEFIGEEDADYAIKVMNMIKLFGKPIRVNKVCGMIHTLHTFHSRILQRFSVVIWILVSVHFLHGILLVEVDCFLCLFV